ncbi:hypothetical protein EVAR_64187_1 [Eumeta japonica]|uniref:Uncharacterized protein n=1 Tax=Eumeta variegata TaxID=151549 RepID=A0A4C1ZHK1_EUMVA|nr:hypothetical protein EVAR_64187_1 [Eumeta japonica]
MQTARLVYFGVSITWHQIASSFGDMLRMFTEFSFCNTGHSRDFELGPRVSIRRLCMVVEYPNGVPTGQTPIVYQQSIFLQNIACVTCDVTTAPVKYGL